MHIPSGPSFMFQDPLQIPKSVNTGILGGGAQHHNYSPRGMPISPEAAPELNVPFSCPTDSGKKYNTIAPLLAYNINRRPTTTVTNKILRHKRKLGIIQEKGKRKKSSRRGDILIIWDKKLATAKVIFA